MKITSSDPKDDLGRSVKGLITSMGLKAKSRPKKCKQERYDIGNVSNKNLSEIIKEFDKLPYQTYERRRPKHEPTNSYFYLARKLVKCMMKSDALNSHVYPVRTDINTIKQIPILHACSTYKSELK